MGVGGGKYQSQQAMLWEGGSSERVGGEKLPQALLSGTNFQLQNKTSHRESLLCLHRTSGSLLDPWGWSPWGRNNCTILRDFVGYSGIHSTRAATSLPPNSLPQFQSLKLFLSIYLFMFELGCTLNVEPNMGFHFMSLRSRAELRWSWMLNRHSHPGAPLFLLKSASQFLLVVTINLDHQWKQAWKKGKGQEAIIINPMRGDADMGKNVGGIRGQWIGDMFWA